MKVTSMREFPDRISTAEEREWLATQYVLGELSAVDADLVEVAMLEDSDLCQLVAQTSIIVAGVEAANQTTETSSTALAIGDLSTGLERRSNWSVKIAIVAALVFAATISLRTSPHSSDIGLTSDEVDILTSSGIALDSEVGESELDIVTEEDEAHDRLISLDAPEWLLTAVELEKESQSDEEDEDEPDVF